MTYVYLLDFIPERNLWEWLLVWSALGFFGMIADKTSAQIGFQRIPEKAFFVTALLGGFWGIVFGGLVRHHKMSKGEFWGYSVIASIPSAGFLALYFSPHLINL